MEDDHPPLAALPTSLRSLSLPVPPDLSAQIDQVLAGDHTPLANPDFRECFQRAGQQISQALRQFFQSLSAAIQRGVRRCMALLRKLCPRLFQPGKHRHYRRRCCNRRVQMVQAKRKRLDLSQDGKCCGLRSRKASYAFRLEEERFYAGRRATPPRLSDYEHVPVRRRRKEARCRLRWKPLESEQERAWIEAMETNTKRLCEASGIPSIKSIQMIGGVIPPGQLLSLGDNDSQPECVWPGAAASISFSPAFLMNSDSLKGINLPGERSS